MAATVHVEGISTKTSEDEIRSFFSFCGRISSISVTPSGDETQSASVTFEKAAAAKTALLLDNTQLGPNSVHVSSAKSIEELAGDHTGSEDTSKDTSDVEQEDKPRSRILAEYLAHGYVISDQAIERAIALDQQHGISAKFTAALKNFDQRFHATEKAQAVDTKFGITAQAASLWKGFTSYFDKAQDTPTGRKLRQFYEAGNKQVVDVHNEARHLADLKKDGASGSTQKPTAEDAGVEKIGEGKTKCNCGANGEKCACPSGQCACSGCAKQSKSAGEGSTAASSYAEAAKE